MKRQPTITASMASGSLSMEIPTSTGTHRFDILAELMWGGSPDDSAVLERHPGLEAWWNAMQADHEAVEAHWHETVYDAYMAHLRRFAVYFLTGQGVRRDKMTQRDIDDSRLRLYSSLLTREQRDTLTATAFHGYMLEKYETSATIKELQAAKPEIYNEHWRNFLADMYAYQGDDPVWIEEMIQMRVSMERDSKLIAAVAGAFRNRGYLLRQAAENEKARRNAMGTTLGIDEIVNKILPQLKKRLSDPMSTVMYEGEPK